MAFHPYTQVIPQVFNPGGFGPPRSLTHASTCPCVDHPASGLQHATLGALFRLAFATAPPHGLTSPHTITRRLILQKARSHITTIPKDGYAPTACRHTVSGTISQPLTGALFTFPSRYSFTIGHQEVFRLTRWSWQIHTGFLEPRATWDTLKKPTRFHLPGSHGLRRPFPEASAIAPVYHFPGERQPSELRRATGVPGRCRIR